MNSKLSLLFCTLFMAVFANEVVLELDKGLISNVTREREYSGPKKSVEVQIPGCSITFFPHPYKQAAQDIWFNLADPGSSTLDPRFKDYKTRTPPDNAPTEYGAEHIYEVKMIAMFIAYLRQASPTLWNPTGATSDFCKWVDTYVMKGFGGRSSLINNLKSCLPNDNRGQHGWMPRLEDWANDMKGKAVAGETIRRKSVFDSYLPKEQVADIRTVVGVATYMKDTNVQLAFNTQSQCIRTEWLTWLPRYANVIPTTVSSSALGTLYDKWVDKLMKDTHQNLVNGFNDMVAWWKAQNNNRVVNVPIDFNSRIGTSPRYSAQASTNTLAGLVQYM